MSGSENATSAPASRRGFLPPLNSRGYYILLGAIAIIVLGPLGGITAAYMNFSLGFFVGGQVLAGILGSVVTYGYGPEGKHGANYMQTMAASVASMSAMGVLTQAMVWLGLPIPPTWQLMIYFLCIGMFGVGVGMLYTPVLVDRMQLTYPSGLAVANILRALTNKALLKRSVTQLGIGTGVGLGGGLVAEAGSVPLLGKVAGLLGSVHFSGSTLGAGMVVGARIGIPAIVVALIGHFMTPWLRTYVPEGATAPLLGPEDPFRKVGFLVALGSILGAAVVDLALIFKAAIARLREKAPAPTANEGPGRGLNIKRLAIWVAFWGTATLIAGNQIMLVPLGYMIFAIALCFLFVLINGISTGISDSNPISSAFVVSVLLMALVGLTQPGIALLAGAVLLVSCSVGCDMQQDRSTGWRLGTNRDIQFRYQVIGITMGAICAVLITKLFMNAYPVLAVNTFDHPEQKIAQWQSAMTYKFVGAVKNITNPDPVKTKLLLLGFGVGIVIEAIRKFLKTNQKYLEFKKATPTGKVTDFLIDAVFLPSPYAASFGGFVDIATSMWFGGGGVIGSVWSWLDERAKKNKPKVAGEEEVPEDMSTVSLAGGGLIAGESLAALTLGIMGLLATLAGK
jgi:uncharacterized oligopeptide transporter (OPT) family protein